MWILWVFLALAIGAVAIVGAVALAVVGHVVAVLWPALLILLGCWLLVRSWRGPGRDRSEWHGAGWHRADGQGRPRRNRAQRPDTLVRAEPAEPAPLPDDDLPGDVAAKVAEIRHKTDVLLGQAQRFSPFSLDLHLVRQTASDYLPRTLELYRALPAGTADVTLTTSGKTAHQELLEQLEILDAKLDEIARELHSEEVDRLLANRRFLEERLGQISA